MHYAHPLSISQQDFLRFQTIQILSARLGRAEPPLKKEVVDYMLDVGSHIWSLRRAKANFFRLISKPIHPPHMDIHLSHAHAVFPDDLDEEFDTFPTRRGPDRVRMRYDRLRSIGGRIKTVIGDLATQGERFHSLLSWRDPRASALFVTFCLFAAVVMYVTPFQVVALLIGLYLLRHPRFRHKLPSMSTSFFKRLPARADCML
ncbi:hypothetical protein T459_01518 [Capsicum annuum]|uniref:Multiple C2 domain-containing protein n=1 Tax=Capsicum annuum TaxID=4072 RepID=A0A2G3AHB4_CAPAN|nr:hypothetical protein T459_01518 [Capsicum annuum]